MKFWTNRWYGDLSLQLAFPVSYNIANKVTSVDSSLVCQGVWDKRTWDVRFIQDPNN